MTPSREQERGKWYRVSVTAKCIGCGSTREIQAGEIPAGDMPMCHCGNVMIATRARAKQKEKR